MPAFYCSACAASHDLPGWTAVCPACQKWNTLEAGSLRREDAAPSPAGREARSVAVAAHAPKPLRRAPTCVGWLDDALCGGLVLGATALLSGWPEAGKTTLLCQIADGASRHVRVLYALGEESIDRWVAKFRRVADTDRPSDVLAFRAYSANEILEEANAIDARLVIVDPISVIGRTPAELGAVATLFADDAAAHERVYLFSSHVTLEGRARGGTTLPHAVDLELELAPEDRPEEGDRMVWTEDSVRVLRVLKNRDAPHRSVRLLMGDDGLSPCEVDALDAPGTPATSPSSPSPGRRRTHLQLVRPRR